MKIHKLVRILGIASLLTSSALAASYIKIEGIDGESKSANHQGWIDVISVSGIAAPRDTATGLATGKRQHKTVTIVKPIDKATPLLQAASDQSGKPVAKPATRKPNNPLHEAQNTEANNPLYTKSMTIDQDGSTYLLHGIKVLSTERKGDTETVTLSYTSMKVMSNATAVKPIKAKAASATDHNSSRSNKTSSK